MSGSKKSEGTTSRLLEAVEEVLKPQSQRYLDIVDALENMHINAVRGVVSINKEEVLAGALRDVYAECQRLRSFMSAAEIIDEISPKSRDIIVSTGEKLSARIFTAALQSQGTPAKYFNLDRLIQKDFDTASIDQSFYDYIVVQLEKLLAPHIDTHVCVLTGYLGPVPGSLLTTIGRGYTDLTAALTSVGLKAIELQIWKEVDGIFTADPRKAPRAKKLDSISPEEVAELTYYGSEVIHPFTMEQVIRASIPIRIKNTFKPQGSGTLILPESHPGAQLDVVTEKSDIARPTAATIKDNVIVLNIHSNRKSVAHGFLAQIFLTLDKFGIVVDLISTSEVHVSMALCQNLDQRFLDKALVELKRYGTVDVLANMAILSVVGRQMKNIHGMASTMFSILARHQVNIEMISQGASEINISCVIAEDCAEEALRAIHDGMIVRNDS